MINSIDDNKLLSLQESESLNINSVKEMYKKYSNNGFVNINSSLGWGSEFAASASGQYIFTENGEKILDFTGGLGVLSHGHNHPRIINARINYQKNNKMEVHKNYFSKYTAALSHNIAKILPENLDNSFFCNSGAEAVDGALKLAYKYHQGKRKIVLHSDKAFHGKLIGAGSVSASDPFVKGDAKFSFQKFQGTDSFVFNSITSLEEKIKEHVGNKGESNIYSVIIEPFSCSILKPCSKEFLYKTVQLCKKYNIVLIFDEIYSGWCKTGHLFYFMKYDICPDILVTSKSFGGGKSSISAYITRKNIYDRAYNSLAGAFLHTTTYNGFGEECATAIEAINIMIEDDYCSKSNQIENWMKPLLIDLKGKHNKIIKDIRGTGCHYGIIFNSEYERFKSLIQLIPNSFFKDPLFLDKLIVTAVMDHMYRNNKIIMTITANDDVALLMSPSLIVEKEDVNNCIKALDETLSNGIIALVSSLLKRKILG